MQPCSVSLLFWALSSFLITSSQGLPHVAGPKFHHDVSIADKDVAYNTPLESRADAGGSTSGTVRRPDQRPERRVWVVTDVDYGFAAFQYGIPGVFTHAHIVLSGTATDGPMAIQIFPKDSLRQQLSGVLTGNTNFRDWAVLARYGVPGKVNHTNPWMRPGPEFGTDGTKRHANLIPEWTRLTNAQILDPHTGKGLAEKLWGDHPWVNLGTGSGTKDYSGPLTFVRKLLEHHSFFGPGWQLPHELSMALRTGAWFWRWQEKALVTIEANRIYTQEVLPEGTTRTSEFAIMVNQDPLKIRVMAPQRIGP